MRGELGFHKWMDGSNSDSMRMRAVLVDSNGDDRLPVMIDAEVLKVTSRGIVIAGTEVVARTPSAKSSVTYFRQVWWCKVLEGEMSATPPKAARLPRWSRSMEHPA